jgi:hypothetical protein
MNYGHFSDDGREYIITDVRTPSPWINYLTNGRYFATISANGGGISYDRSPLHGRITRYRINDVPPDRPGKYIYVKDLDSGEIWSLTWQPVGHEPAAAYRVAHGFGYTRAEAEVAGIASSVVFFVPLDDDRAGAPPRGRRLRRVRPGSCPRRPHQPVRRPAFQPRPFRQRARRAIRHENVLGHRNPGHSAAGEQGVGPLGLFHGEPAGRRLRDLARAVHRALPERI